jgi:hypothetical protein
MNNRTNIGILVALIMGLQVMALVIAQPSYGYWAYGHRYGYPAYYAPAYNNYGYRGYAPYPRYGYGSGINVGPVHIGGLLGPPRGHWYRGRWYY